jgi:hypothetical protein
VGDLSQARQKWERAREWRRRFEINKVGIPEAALLSGLRCLKGHLRDRQILERPHPLYDTIYNTFTQCFLSNARNGDAVLLTRAGQIQVSHVSNCCRTPSAHLTVTPFDLAALKATCAGG